MPRQLTDNLRRIHRGAAKTDEHGASDSELSVDSREQRTRSRSKSKSTHKRVSSRRSPSPPARRYKSSHGDSDSEVEDTQLPERFIDKENQRFDSNAGIMVRRNSGRAAKQPPLPTKVSRQSKRKFEELQKENEEKDEKLAALEKEVADLKEKPQSLVVIAQSSGKLGYEEKEWRGRIWKATKSAIWSCCKFISTEKKLLRATKAVFNHMNLKEFNDMPDGQDKEKEIATWVTQNADHVRTGMNDVRNYAQGELRKVVVDRLMAGKVVPTNDVMLECATRVDCGTGEKNQEIFDFYVDVLLPKVALTENWDTNHRHYQRVSAAHHQGNPTKMCVTVSTEAFLVLMFLNCNKKWAYLKQCKVDSKKEDRKDKEYKSPYTEVAKGQQKYGGWNLKGKQKFKELCMLISEARKMEGVEQVEEACLQRLRAKHNVEERDRKRAIRGRKRRGVVQEEESEDEWDNI